MKKMNINKRKAFGGLLKDCRIKGGFTVRKVAEIIEAPFGVLASIERGEEVKLKMRYIESLCALYNLNLDQICIQLERVPTEIFYKIIDSPKLLEIIRNYEVK